MCSMDSSISKVAESSQTLCMQAAKILSFVLTDSITRTTALLSQKIYGRVFPEPAPESYGYDNFQHFQVNNSKVETWSLKNWSTVNPVIPDSPNACKRGTQV